MAPSGRRPFLFDPSSFARRRARSARLADAGGRAGRRRRGARTPLSPPNQHFSAIRTTVDTRFRGPRQHAHTVPRRATAVPRGFSTWIKGVTDGFERGVRSQMRGRAAWTGGVLDDNLRVAMYDGTLVIERWREGQRRIFGARASEIFTASGPRVGPGQRRDAGS